MLVQLDSLPKQAEICRAVLQGDASRETAANRQSLPSQIRREVGYCNPPHKLHRDPQTLHVQ